jgi:hypothetical protein
LARAGLCNEGFNVIFGPVSQRRAEKNRERDYEDSDNDALKKIWGWELGTFQDYGASLSLSRQSLVRDFSAFTETMG